MHALDRAARRAAAEAIDESLASIGRPALKDLSDDELETVYAEMIASAPPIPAEFADRFEVPAPAGRVDVPITVGKRR